MKKVVAISFICIYSFATMGFSLRQFYCCGKLKSITISLTQDTKKGDISNKKRGCCNNLYQFFKVKFNHITADQVNSPFKCFIDLHLYTPALNEISFASRKISISYRSNAPPLHTRGPLYIYNCVFRI
jgi:hypothetical protein